MNKKIILSILGIILLTGCSANYDVEINKDLMVKEDLSIIGDDRFNITTEYTVDTMYNTLIETYSELINDGDLDNINKYSKNNNMAISVSKTYANLTDFGKSKYIKKIYADGLTVSTKKSIVSITSGTTLDNFWLFVNGMEEDPLIGKLNVNIKVPYVVTENNADKVDKKNNIFTWSYNFQDSSKSINLEFDKNREFVSGIDTKKVIKYILYVIGILLIGFGIYKMTKNKNKKNNKV